MAQAHTQFTHTHTHTPKKKIAVNGKYIHDLIIIAKKVNEQKRRAKEYKNRNGVKDTNH